MNGNRKTTAETQMQGKFLVIPYTLTFPHYKILVAIGLLLDTTGDKSSLVTDTVDCALRRIAKYHPNEILKACCIYCGRTAKNNGENVLIVMNIMHNVCLEYIVEIDGDTILVLIDLCMESMIQNQYNEMHRVEFAASNILVALGKKHSIQVSVWSL